MSKSTKFASGKHTEKQEQAIKTANIDKVLEQDKRDIAEQQAMHPKVAAKVAATVEPVKAVSGTYRYVSKDGTSLTIDMDKIHQVYGMPASRQVVEYWQGQKMSKAESVWLSTCIMVTVSQKVNGKGLLVSEVLQGLNTFTLAIWQELGTLLTKQVASLDKTYYVRDGIRLASGQDVGKTTKAGLMTATLAKLGNKQAYRDNVLLPWLTKATNDTIDMDKAKVAMNEVLSITE